MKDKILNIFIYTLGVMSYTLIQWLMLTLITRYLSLEDGGKYAYYFAIFTPMFILFSFGLRNSIATDSKLEFSNKDYMAVQLIGFVIFCSIGIAYLSYENWNYIGTLVFLIKAFDMLSELPYGNWIKEKKAYKYGVSRLLKTSIFLLLIYIFYIVYGANKYLFFIYPIVILSIFLLYDLRSNVYKKETRNTKNHSLYLIKKSLPLAVGSLVVSLSSVIPRVFLERFNDFETVGIYSIAIYIYSIAALPLTIMMQLILPRISNMTNINNSFMSKLKFLVLLYTLVVSTFVFLLINPLVKFVYNIDYIFTNLQICLLIGYGFFQIFLVYYNSILIGKRNFSAFGRISFYILFINLIISYVLIGSYGIIGAFISAMTVSLISVFSIFITLNYKEKL